MTSILSVILSLLFFFKLGTKLDSVFFSDCISIVRKTMFSPTHQENILHSSFLLYFMGKLMVKYLIYHIT